MQMNLRTSNKVFTTLILIPFVGSYSFAQNSSSSANLLGQNLAKNVNVVTTAVPFLIITPDAREGGMGDAGVATSPDANSIAYNTAKLGFIENNMGFDVSYTPWLRQLVPDINLGYLSFYKRLDEHQVISFALRYFSPAKITCCPLGPITGLPGVLSISYTGGVGTSNLVRSSAQVILL